MNQCKDVNNIDVNVNNNNDSTNREFDVDEIPMLPITQRTKPLPSVVIVNANHELRTEMNEKVKRDVMTLIGDGTDICVVRENILTKHNGITYKEKHKGIYNMKGKIPLFRVNMRLGVSESVDGEAHALCYPIKYIKSKDRIVTDTVPVCDADAKEYNVAIKFVPMSQYDSMNHYSLRSNVWAELHVLRHTSDYVTSSVSPHYQYYYMFSICNDTLPDNYDNTNVKDVFNNQSVFDAIFEDFARGEPQLGTIVNIKNHGQIKTNMLNAIRSVNKMNEQYSNDRMTENSMVIYNELASFDLSVWFKTLGSKLTPDIIYNVLFQIYAALIPLHRDSIIHMDLHMSNILIVKLETETLYDAKDATSYWEYKINGSKYYCPNMGFQVRVCDFGRVVMLNSDSPEYVTNELMANINRFFNHKYIDSYADGIIKNIASKGSKKTQELKRNLISSFDVYRITDIIHYKLEMRRDPQWRQLLRTIKGIVSNTVTDFVETLGDSLTPNSHSVGNAVSCIVENFDMYRGTTHLPRGYTTLNSRPYA